jgi:uncharacterized protein (DUF433 family)
MVSHQRSFRLSQETLESLDRAAELSGESRNALVDRMLGEALRLERHPLVRFQHSASGRRQPLLVGTRLYVHQIVATVRANDGDIDETADYLGVPPRLIRAALDYYAEFVEEVDADAVLAERVEDEERARWERQQHALG